MTTAAKMKRAICIIAIIASIVYIPIANSNMKGYYLNYVKSNTYGADFYTDTQNAIADTCNNVSGVGVTLGNGLSFINIFLGSFSALFWAYLLCKACESKDEDKTNESTVIASSSRAADLASAEREKTNYSTGSNGWKCSNCGHTNLSGLISCSVCGRYR